MNEFSVVSADEQNLIEGGAVDPSCGQSSGSGSIWGGNPPHKLPTPIHVVPPVLPIPGLPGVFGH
jgi:hypothetical protein